MKGMLFYGFFGALGMGYIFAAGSLLRSPPSGWYVLTFLWWAMLGWIAYWRHRKRTKMVVTQVEQRGIRWRLILEGFLFLALLVCLMGAAITLSVSLELHQSPLRGVFWLVGVFAATILARRNRRAIVVTAFRAFSALMLVGALTKLPSVAGFAVALIVAIALFVLSRLASRNPRLGHG